MVIIETATVYRAGGRRYFTKRAACTALARTKLKERCECDYCDHDELPGSPREDLPCSLHAYPRHEKIMRRLTRIYMKAMADTASGRAQRTNNNEG